MKIIRVLKTKDIIQKTGRFRIGAYIAMLTAGFVVFGLSTQMLDAAAKAHN